MATIQGERLGRSVPQNATSKRVRSLISRHISAIGSLTLLAVILIAWEAVGRLDIVNHRILPWPTEVFPAFFEVVSRDYFFTHFQATMYEIGVGYTYAVVSGLAIGIILSFSAFLRLALMPLIIVLEVIPKVALIPLIIVWFGYDEASKIAVVTILAFFPIFLNTLSGLSEHDEDGRRLLHSMGANTWQHFKMHQLPTALPAIFAGLRIGLTLAFIGAIVAELLTINKGLGFLVLTFKNNLQMDFVYAITIILAGLGAFFFFLVEFIERKVVFWTGEGDVEVTNL
ncbi:MAG: ABC transporter permease subunit [Dehalococcoidia bacterium]|nr:ABC transporter permease subunit [Dehalococcoidia bacterium]